MASERMWTSKLGGKYPHAWMQQQDGQSQRELKRLRGLRAEGNHLCADCGSPDSSWASVSHGVFLCVVCSDVHRAVGTHISKVKGCRTSRTTSGSSQSSAEAKLSSYADAAAVAEKPVWAARKQQLPHASAATSAAGISKLAAHSQNQLLRSQR